MNGLKGKMRIWAEIVAQNLLILLIFCFGRKEDSAVHPVGRAITEWKKDEPVVSKEQTFDNPPCCAW